MKPDDDRTRVLFMQSQTFFGADSAVHALLMRYFDRNAIEVHVACNAGTPDEPPHALHALETIPGISIRPTHFGTSLNSQSKQRVLLETARSGIPSLFSLVGLAAYARRHHIDIVHCTEKPRDAFYGLLLSRLVGARCVIHIHVKAENWISPLVRWAMKHADLLLGVSSFVADSIVQLGYPAEKTRYALNCLDLAAWDGRADGQGIRNEFGVDQDTPLMAIVSRLFSWKGHTELIEALAIVKRTVPKFKLLIVGEDDPRANPGGGAYSQDLRKLAVDRGLMEQIVFTGFRRDIPNIMAACDIYTMPSFEEPFGMVYVEAMALSKPVIALDNGGAREIVVHRETGLLSPPKDIELLAANIVTLLLDRGLRERMGKAGRRRLEECFAAPHAARNVEAIYRELQGKPPISPA